MKQKIRLVAGLLLFIALFGSLRISTKASDLSYQLLNEKITKLWLNNFADEDKILAVCQSTPKFPKGWVVVGQGNVNDCRNNSLAQPLYNAWYIKRPAKQEWVCQGSPMPDNYIVAGEVKIADCPGGSSLIENKNGWIIKLVE